MAEANSLKKKQDEEQDKKRPLLIAFFLSKRFWLHLAIALVIIVLMFWGVFSYLNSYTNHDASVTVPTFITEQAADLDRLTKEVQLNYVIVDSVHDDVADIGSVVKQDPLAGEVVKPGRTVYITIVRKLPKMIQMPNLVDKTSRQASAFLNMIGLEVKKIETRPSQFPGSVLEQLYDGAPVDSGVMLMKGSGITLVVGAEGNDRKPIPNLNALTIAEAKLRLNEATLNLGAEIYLNCPTALDSANARVYKQSPTSGGMSMATSGTSVDVWLDSNSTTTQPTDSTAGGTRPNP